MNLYFSKSISENNISLTDLAKKLNCSVGMVWQWKHGKRGISLEQAVRIEIATGGAIKAAKLNCEFFKMLNQIGYKKVNYRPSNDDKSNKISNKITLKN